MNVLLDECAPRALKRYLASSGHMCSTVQEQGWSGIRNGELLGQAEGQFEVFVTVDAKSALSAESGRAQYRRHRHPFDIKSLGISAPALRSMPLRDTSWHPEARTALLN